ncbi:hypothetical protein SEA_STICKYNOTE_27 [Corynebacterium phage Stickynote]|uniref:Minor tail protein n=1 Tax=Corynebacterium phage Stickynote TaxID=2588503 RepID=A0A4Y6EV11_9CAUD|nr:tail protein [Corynebacterium phage Stickynote]QDF19224.1 hypothetical protein SEA_STICKYNOTE_27 [Corynebacterium phage Stickynote]
MLSNPPSTGDVELDNFLRSVKTHIDDALRPADGWRLSDLSADVSEVISDKRDLIDIVTAYNDINILKDSVDLALADFKATANQYQDHAEVFSHTTEWWDQNRKIIEDASQAMAATILASGYADAAAADRVQTGADREATEAAAARAEQSETNAEESATTASTAAAEATDAMEIASEAALSADDGASRAAESADSASQSQAEAATHAQNASAAADRIGTAEQVGEWAQQAASSASSASASESAAEEAATRAEQHEAGAEAALSTKADVVHTHSIEQVNGLQTSLDGKASLVGGLIPTSQLPAVALTKPQVVPDRAGMLALTAQEGDVAVITEGADKGTYMLGPGASTNFASWVALATPTDAVTSVNGQTGVVNLSASNVGAAPSSHTHTSAQISDAVSTATASTVVKRDASARAKFADPAAAQDAATKGYVDTGLSGKAAASHTHTSADITDATSILASGIAGNESRPVVTNASGKVEIGTDSIVDAGDVVNKEYADNLVDWNNTLQHRLWGHVPFFTDGGISSERVWLNEKNNFAASVGELNSRTPQVQVVSALPSSPVADVVYIVKG